MMNALNYEGPNGHRAYLTTDSPASHYGVPALRVLGPGLDGLPDLGPRDELPSGMFAADLVEQALHGTLLIGFGGALFAMTPDEQEAARRFLAQWPDRTKPS